MKQQKFTPLQIAKNWLKLIVLLGIAPWGYVYFLYVGPSVHSFFGLHSAPLWLYLVPIIAPPAALFYWLLDPHDFVESDEEAK